LRTHPHLALTDALLLRPKTQSIGSLAEPNEAEASRRDALLLTSLLEGVSPIRTQHRLLGTEDSAKIGKPLLGLLGLIGTISLRSRHPKLGIKLLCSEVLTGPKLKRPLPHALIGKRRLKIGSLIHLLHVLGVRNIELLGHIPSRLIRQRSLKRRLLIGPRSIEGAADVELTSLKLGSNVGLLTGNVRPEHIRSQRLTLLLGSKKLLVDLLGSSDVLHRPLTRSPRTGESLARNGRIVHQTTGRSKALTGALRSRPNLLGRELAGGHRHRQTTSLQNLRKRALLLGVQSLLI
jgi:hypothetical protein